MTRPFHSQSSQQGIALVIVLGFLVLITTFALAFFTSVSNDAKMSGTYSRNIQTGQLAQSVVSIAMGQIKDATTQKSDVTWASQPGMIRTFNSSGGVVNSYRLYSSSAMKIGGSYNVSADEHSDYRARWSIYKAHMMDINRPVSDASGKLVYPIFDPRSETDPDNKVEGIKFDLEGMGAQFTTPTNPAPMPVRWLYVLAKGDIVTGNMTSNTKATFPTGSKDNPVVGRIAFWTDDESSKVNINTAAGDEWKPAAASYGTPAGSYWDAPRTNSTYDRQAFANFQPAQGEYQRYPGHPATTYLSAVFPNLTSQQIGDITTRIQRGGSLGGTTLSTVKVPGDADRLYASVDELMFQQALDPSTKRRKDQPITKEQLELGRFFLTANSRAPEVNLFNKPRVAIWPIPKTDSTAARSPYDRLIAFCSTISPDPNDPSKKYSYYFDRSSADSTTADYGGRNVEVYKYLQGLMNTKVPGNGSKFVDKYGQADCDQILTEILDYIRSTNLYDDTVTSGQQFTDLRTSETGVNIGHGQVTPLKITTTAAATMGFGRFYTISEAALHFICTGDADTSATTPPETKLARQASNVLGNKTLGGALLKETPAAGGNPAKAERRIETILLLELFSPSQGWTGLRPDMQIKITGLDKFKVNGSTFLGFPASGTMQLTQSGTSTYHGRAWGGSAGFRFPLSSPLGGRRTDVRGSMPKDSGLNDNNKYPFVGVPITVEVPETGAKTMAFTGGDLKVEIYTGATAPQNTGTLVQTMTINFPNGTFPVPDLVTTGTPQQAVTAPATPASSATEKEVWWTFSADGCMANAKGRLNGVNRAPGSDTKPEEGAFIRAEDVVRSVLPYHGDYRLVAAKATVPNTVFLKHQNYDNQSIKLAHGLMEAVGKKYTQGSDVNGKLVPDDTATHSNVTYAWGQYPDVPYLDPASTNTEVVNSRTRLMRGDWDTGMTTIADGAYINKPDEGNNYRGAGKNELPYFDHNETQQSGGETFFSPNRQIPSAVMFGSLPTGLWADGGTIGRSWRTLLFRPDPTGAHDGWKTNLRDHLLLDLFWMPVVEPYAISEPFSTAGKINLNYQIAPFSYIKRTTALRALFRSERVTAIGTDQGGTYKAATTGTYHYEIDADETLKQFETRFTADKPFRSASEICELYLVPKTASGQPTTETIATMPDFWKKKSALTGDNLRERPYATLYPRLTTKSNVYSVHYCVQTLRQVNRKTADWNVWDETKDAITGEARGTTIIERYVDLQDPKLPDFATLPADSTETLDTYTKLRVLTNRRFAP